MAADSRVLRIAVATCLDLAESTTDESARERLLIMAAQLLGQVDPVPTDESDATGPARASMTKH